MAGNRKPKKPDQRFNPEQEGGEEEEDEVDDDNDEEEEHLDRPAHLLVHLLILHLHTRYDS